MQSVVSKREAHTKTKNPGTAEIKLVTVFVVHLISGTAALAAFTYYSINSGRKINTELSNYVICTSVGSDDNCVFPRTLETLYRMIDASQIVLSFIPALNIFFAMNFKTCREKVSKAWPKQLQFSRSTDSTKPSKKSGSSIPLQQNNT